MGKPALTTLGVALLLLVVVASLVLPDWLFKERNLPGSICPTPPRARPCPTCPASPVDPPPPKQEPAPNCRHCPTPECPICPAPACPSPGYPPSPKCPLCPLAITCPNASATSKRLYQAPAKTVDEVIGFDSKYGNRYGGLYHRSIVSDLFPTHSVKWLFRPLRAAGQSALVYGRGVVGGGVRCVAAGVGRKVIPWAGRN